MIELFIYLYISAVGVVMTCLFSEMRYSIRRSCCIIVWYLVVLMAVDAGVWG